MLKKLLIALPLFLGYCQQSQAQQSSPKLDEWLAQHAQSMGGRVYLTVYKDGKIIYSHAAENITLRQKRIETFLAKRQGKLADFNNYTDTTKIPIASCSKWLSAALVMTFVDEGKLRLSDTVGKFLPILSQNGKGNITIGECLSHTTGIDPEGLQQDLKAMRSMSSMDEAIARISKMPPEGQPGKVFHYGNEGLQIAGAVIEKISGKSFETLFRERIAKPLEMKNTDFGKKKVVLPAGGSSSTPEDYMHFLIMILNKGMYNGKRILSEKSVAKMQTNRITQDVKVAYSPMEAGTIGYGLGEWIIGNSVSSPGLFGSFPWVCNEKGYCAILMSYNMNSENRHKNYGELKQLVETELIQK